MAEVIRMPRLSDTMEEGNIVSWLKNVGDAVEPGDILAEVETDKATMDLESFNSGVLLHIGVEKGPVAVEGVIAIIGNKDEDISSILKEIESEANGSPKPVAVETPKAESIAPEAVTATAAPSVQTSAPAVISNDGRIKASPLAKKLAKENNIDISQVRGSGESGRIVKRDIDKAVQSGISSITPTIPSVTIALPQHLDESIYGDKPLSQMRKIIAKRLGESKFTSPHFYLTMEIDMDKTIEARTAINEESEIRISFNDFIVKACASALRLNPMINASWHDDKITYHKDINIGVAVAIDEGLVVPVIRNTDLKSLSMIKNEIKVLATKAKERKIQPEEMSGNTFTISNLGMFDIDEFTAIINPPDACILAVGSIVEKPIVKGGEIVIGSMMKVTLSCDHRIVDGVKGAMFLQTVKSLLENPVKILL